MSSTAKPLSEDDTADFAAAVQQGVADAEADRVLPYEVVRKWLLSWGTEDELPIPPCP